MKHFLLKIFSSTIALALCIVAHAQIEEPNDTFFLLKKKGILKRLGESIYRETPPDDPVKSVDPFLKYKGMTIRTIEIAPTGFGNADDTPEAMRSYASRMADRLHKNTLPNVIRKNLFFKEGDKVLPFLFSDNERFLRELAFLRDALIEVELSPGRKDMVDVLIITRDVFSIGGTINISSITNARMTIKEDNLMGTGNNIEGAFFYDKDRSNPCGFGASVIQRNIRHSFINWIAGFNNFSPAFNTGNRDEKIWHTSLDKPLTSRYTRFTGAVSVSYKVSTNGYFTDSLYTSDLRYKVLATDLWGGYNIGTRSKKYRDNGNRLRHFVALRTFYTIFDKIPERFRDIYNFNYADINGLLASYTLYRQNFFKTKFVYGFGRNEDIPEGINASFISGYTNKQGIKRAYYGVEFDVTNYSLKDFYTGYTMKLGGFARKKNYRDIDLLLQIDHFTKLYRLAPKWLSRYFLSVNFTKQFKSELAAPLFLQSSYGLPYFRNNANLMDTRATIKFETVFYNLSYILGFRVAPFVFADASFLKPQHQSIQKTDGYTAIGGGFRTRNENLTLGTIELRGFYFPRVTDGMKNWRVELTTNFRFRFNSSFIRKPDFISAN